MRAVNLLPAQNRGSRQAQVLPGLSKQSWIACSAGVGVVALGGVLLATVLASSTVSSRQKALQRLDQQIASLPKPKAVAGADTLAMRQSTISNLASQRMTWDDFLLGIAHVTPEDVWVMSLTGDNNGGVAPGVVSAAPSSSFTLSGYTYSPPSVARLMRRLELVPWLSNVSLTSSSKSAIGNTRVYQFTVGASINPLPEVGS